MQTFSITLTDTQAKAMSHITKSIEEYIQNFASVRAESAVDEISQLLIRECLSTGAQIPQSKNEMVDLAFAQKLIKTAEEIELEIAARVAQAQ